MDETQKMLRAIINGQSSIRSDLMGEIKKLDKKFDKLNHELQEFKKEAKQDHKETHKRIDRLGLQIAELEDDAPTREEHDRLEHKVSKIEHRLMAA